jgi:DNA-binding transcriptional LysR family regulator
MEVKPVIDLKVLYYFTVLAEERHFGIAAKRIGIEQPPLSLQIQKLERIMATELFDRSKRQIKLTAAGETLLPEAYHLLKQSKQLVDNIKSVGRGESGIIQIGFATSTIFSGITTAIQSQKEQYPKVELRLREMSSAAQIEALKNGTIDIGFIREAGEHEQIISKQIIKERFIAVVSNQHRLAKKEAIKLKELEGEAFVHFPREVAPALFDKVNLVFSKAKFRPNIVQEAYEWQTIVSLVEANLGVSICPASFQKLKIGKVQYKPFTDIKTETHIAVCYNINNKSRLIAPFIKVLEEHLGE